MFQTAHPSCENVPTYYTCTEMACFVFAFLGDMSSTWVLNAGRNVVQEEVGVPGRRRMTQVVGDGVQRQNRTEFDLVQEVAEKRRNLVYLSVRRCDMMQSASHITTSAPEFGAMRP